MEGALLAFAGRVGGNHAAQRLDAIPFDSRHRFMAAMTEGAPPPRGGPGGGGGGGGRGAPRAA